MLTAAGQYTQNGVSAGARPIFDRSASSVLILKTTVCDRTA